MFSLFSITEHILFALAIMPISTILAAIPIMAISGYVNTDTLAKKIHRALKYELPHIARHVVALAVVCTAVVFWFFPYGSLIPLCMLAAMFYFYLGRLGTFIERTAFTAAYATCFVLLATFASGMLLGELNKYAITGASHRIQTSNGDIVGALLRSGERGVLIFNMERREVMFLQWSDIKRVTLIR
jgi:hypothetical protein